MTRARTFRSAATVCVLLGTALISASPAHAAVTSPPDISPPDTSITIFPDPELTPGPVSFEFTSSEPGTFKCAMDDAPMLACQKSYTTTVTTLGPHTFFVAAVDVSNNEDRSPAMYTFTVVAPVLTPATVTAEDFAGKGKLRIDVDPDWAFGNYPLTVQRLKSGKWKTARVSSTHGSSDVRTINLRAGRYRVVTGPTNSLAGAVSATVRLRR